MRIQQIRWSFLNLSLWKEYRLKGVSPELKTIPNNISPALLFLRQHSLLQFSQLIDIIVSDLPGKQHRFSVCYLLFSPFYNMRLRLFVKVNAVVPLVSATYIFESANWLEREV